jgi:protein-ribulosamine 3-kinase
MNPWPDIETEIAAATGESYAIERRDAIGGGGINATFRVSGGGRSYFVKTNDAARADMFAAEAAGLTELAATKTIRVPRLICHGANAQASWIVLEFIELGRGGDSGMRVLGAQLAELHRVTAPRFGWNRDNTIGATPQTNAPSDEWVAFWRQHRLGYQLALAAGNGHAGALQREGERLMEKMPEFFRTYAPRPSLLHGDLWSGNAAFDSAGAPVLFDPAVYFGDREADMAMTELFGGFSADFYAVYHEAWPLDPGYTVRRDLYNLYHVLNHLNLFGGGYLAQSQRLMSRLLAAVQ